MRRVLIWFLIGVAATGAPSCTASADCEDETAELAAMLRKLPRASRVTMSIAQPEKLMVLDKGIVAPHDFVWEPVLVHVSRDTIHHRGERISAANPDDVAHQLRELFEAERLRLEMFGSDRGIKDARLLLVVEPDAPWSLVGALLEGVRLTGETRAYLVFRRDTVIPPPPKSKISAELDKILHSEEPSMRAVRLAEVVSDLFGRCDQAKKLFASMAAQAPELREETLRTELAGTIRDCRCKCDVPSVRTVMYALFAPSFEAAVVTATLGSSSSDVDLNILTIPASTPWSDAHKQVVAAREKPTAFAIGGQAPPVEPLK